MILNRTSFLSGAACIILAALTLFSASEASASCNTFTVFPNDTGWSFNVAAGLTQSKIITVENLTDSTQTYTALVTTMFGLSWPQGKVTIQPHDTASLYVTFQPPLGTVGGTTEGALTIAMYYDPTCKYILPLHGTVPGGGGLPKTVTISPNYSVSFGPIAAGNDTCILYTLTNNTGTKVSITSMKFRDGTNDFSISPSFNGGSIDSASSYHFSVCFKADPNKSLVYDSLQIIVQYGGAPHTLYAALIGRTTAPPPPGAVTVTPSSYDFGTVFYGSKSCKDFVFTNTSTSPVIILDWNSTDTGVFSVSPAYKSYLDSVTLYPGTSKTFSVCYTPSGAGQYSKYTFAVDYQILVPPYNVIALPVMIYGNSFDSNNSNTICLETQQGDNDNDPIVVGTTANHTMLLINKSASDMIVTGAQLSGDPVFNSVTQFPLTVPARTNNTVYTYQFAPTSTSKSAFGGKVVFTVSDTMTTCHTASGAVVGYITSAGTPVDTTVRAIFSSDHILAIEGSDNQPASTTFYFTNNLSVDATIKNISVDSTQYFQVTSTNPTPTPFVLHPADKLTVVISFIATDHLVHKAHLIIDADHNLQSPTFDLEGLTLAPSGVSNTLPAGVEISITPNPATDFIMVNVNGASSADIQIYDLLGKTVATGNAFNCKLSTANFPPGSYIVRIAGTSIKGEQFVSSKRIIVAR